MGARFERYLEDRIVVVPGDISEEGPPGGKGGDPIKRGQIDAVVHCAGLVNFEASLEKALVANTLGVANVIEFCRKLDARLLHISTCYAAGGADGHRYEEDFPIDWCPDDRQPHFNVRREIRDARAAIDRIEAASREQANYAEFKDSDGATRSRRQPKRAKASAKAGASDGSRRSSSRRGSTRALRWGWPNTYSYTKSMGEQLVLAAARRTGRDRGASGGNRKRADRSVAGMEPGRQHQRPAHLSVGRGIPLLSGARPTWCWSRPGRHGGPSDGPDTGRVVAGPPGAHLPARLLGLSIRSP